MKTVKVIRVTLDPINEKQTVGMHGEHFQDFVYLMLCYAWNFGLIEAELWEDIPQIAEAATLHDIGKRAMPRELVNKKGRLTAKEYERMMEHTITGALGVRHYAPEIFDDVTYEYAREICLHHHERVNGRGYPEGLCGGEIENYVQVVSLADVYDALRSDRSYRKGISHDKAVEMICNEECGAFDPDLFDAFAPVLDRFWEIARSSASDSDLID